MKEISHIDKGIETVIEDGKKIIQIVVVAELPTRPEECADISPCVNDPQIEDEWPWPAGYCWEAGHPYPPPWPCSVEDCCTGLPGQCATALWIGCGTGAGIGCEYLWTEVFIHFWDWDPPLPESQICRWECTGTVLLPDPPPWGTCVCTYTYASNNCPKEMSFFDATKMFNFIKEIDSNDAKIKEIKDIEHKECQILPDNSFKFGLKIPNSKMFVISNADFFFCKKVYEKTGIYAAVNSEICNQCEKDDKIFAYLCKGTIKSHEDNKNRILKKHPCDDKSLKADYDQTVIMYSSYPRKGLPPLEQEKVEFEEYKNRRIKCANCGESDCPLKQGCCWWQKMIYKKWRCRLPVPVS